MKQSCWQKPNWKTRCANRRNNATNVIRHESESDPLRLGRQLDLPLCRNRDNGERRGVGRGVALDGVVRLQLRADQERRGVRQGAGTLRGMDGAAVGRQAEVGLPKKHVPFFGKACTLFTESMAASRIVQSGRTIGTGNSGDKVSGSNPLPGTK